jgi:predicted DNA-binding transcriptional regulator AlpA
MNNLQHLLFLDHVGSLCATGETRYHQSPASPSQCAHQDDRHRKAVTTGIMSEAQPCSRATSSDDVTIAFGVDASRAARLCGISRATWYTLQHAGRIPQPVRLGRRVVWRVEELRAWMNGGCPPLHRWEQMKKGLWI